MSIPPGDRLPDLDDEIIAEAETSVGRTPEERNSMFCSIQRLVGSIWSRLSREEMRRRLEISERLDPRPEPWWRNIRIEGME
jgi:hypothetical protein